MTKLYTVRVSYDYVVVADNVENAEAVGRGYAREALGDLSIFDVDIDIVGGASAYGWDDDCIPYGGDGNKRTGEYK
jgi:hypothetical protein